MLAKLSCAIWIVAGCQSTGGQIASKLGGAVADAASRGGGSAPEHERWSTGRARCGIFADYQLACPVLPGCEGLYRTHDPVTTNVCDAGAGVLKPITTCTGWGGSEHWCSAGSFPQCRRWRGAACGELELLICEDDDKTRRVLRCCSAEPESGECEPNEYYEPRRREPEAGPESAALRVFDIGPSAPQAAFRARRRCLGADLTVSTTPTTARSAALTAAALPK